MNIIATKLTPNPVSNVKKNHILTPLHASRVRIFTTPNLVSNM